MSATAIKISSFGDDQQFDPSSTPEISYNIKPALPAPKSAAGPTATVGPSCKVHEPPWPSIIIGVLGAIVVIYIAVAPGVATDRRLFGVIIMALWTIVWALILWVLWKECHRVASWWLLLIPIAIMAIFFILIIIMNIGAP